MPVRNWRTGWAFFLAFPCLTPHLGLRAGIAWVDQLLLSLGDQVQQTR